MKNNFQNKANYIFWQILSIGLFFLIIALFLGILIYPKLFLIAKSTLIKLETACGCTNNFSFINNPFIFSVLILTGLVLTLFLTFSFIKLIRFRWATNRFIQSAIKDRKNVFSSKLKEVIKGLKLKIRIIETKSKNPVVFCFGFFRPKICLSQGLIKRLSKSELRAVLLHEQHHALVYEPIKLFIVKLFEKILFFVPGIKILVKQYVAYCEIAADECATHGFSQKIPLASALNKMINWEKQILLRNSLAISFFTSIIGERANKLADDTYAPRFKLFTKRFLFGGIIILAIVFFLGYFLFSSEEVFAIHEVNGCLLTHQEVNINVSAKCNMASSGSSCSGISYTDTNILCETVDN